MLDQIKIKLGDLLRSSKKPIVGFVASAITYYAAKLGLDLNLIEGVDEPVLLAGFAYAVAVRLATPIFGQPQVESPVVKTDRHGRQHIER